MAKSRYFILAGMGILLLLAAVVTNQYRSPTGAATGGAGGCGGDPVLEEQTAMAALTGGPVDSVALAEHLNSTPSITSFDDNALTYLANLYGFVGGDELLLTPTITWVSPKEMAAAYKGKYAANSPKLPIGSFKKKGGHYHITLRQGITLGQALRAVHHELGHIWAEQEKAHQAGQYFAELNRIFMMMAAYAHDPHLGSLQVGALVTPLPKTGSEMDDYQRAYVLAFDLLAKTGFDLEASQELLLSKKIKTINELAMGVADPTPLNGVINALMAIKQGSQYNFEPAYVEYVISMVRVAQLYAPMVAAYTDKLDDEALMLAHQIIDALAASPFDQFPLVCEREINAFGIAAVLHANAGEHETIRKLSDAFWARFPDYLTGQLRHPAFQHRGPSVLFSRAIAEDALHDKLAAHEWALRVLAFKDWYDYEPDSLGGKTLALAETMVATYSSAP